MVRRALWEARTRAVRLARRRIRRVSGKTAAERARAVEGILERLPRRTIDRVAADSATPDDDAQAFAVVALERRGPAHLIREATSGPSWRGPWRRIAALRVLSRAAHPEALPLLERALGDADRRIVAAAVAALGRMPVAEAADLLVEALRRRRGPASRIATELENFSIPIGEHLAPLLADPLPAARYWGAALLARYPALPGLGETLALLANDADPGVRKTVVQTLGAIGGPAAGPAALRLLEDPVPFVRANAARSVGRLRLVGQAGQVTPLLADRDWWVRLAAKEALVALGPESWPAVARALDSPDAFARNGAAEVLQNGGALAGLILQAAAGPLDAEGRALLRRATESGGPGMLEGLLDGVPPGLAARIRASACEAGLTEAAP